MDPTPTPARDYLVLKVAAGVVIGGIVLLGIAKYCGLVVLAGTSAVPAAPAPTVASTPVQPPADHPEPTHSTKVEHAASPATTATSTAAKDVVLPAAPASTVTAKAVASPESEMPTAAEVPASGDAASGPEQDQVRTDVANDAATQSTVSAASGKTDVKPRKLEPVPDGDRCIEGRLFRVLPNGFEQITDGSEKRYCG